MDEPVVDKSLRRRLLDKRHRMAMMTIRMMTRPAMAMPIAKSR